MQKYIFECPLIRYLNKDNVCLVSIILYLLGILFQQYSNILYVRNSPLNMDNNYILKENANEGTEVVWDANERIENR
jgi:hypothetical protein